MSKDKTPMKRQEGNGCSAANCSAIVECDGATHYAGCACHERGWQNKWDSAVQMAAQAEAKLDATRNALRHAAELLNDIMNDEVNAQDEAEKWLRAYAPDVLAQNFASPSNAKLCQQGADTTKEL